MIVHPGLVSPEQLLLIHFLSEDISYLTFIEITIMNIWAKFLDTISYLMFHVMSQENCEDVRVCPTTQSEDLQVDRLTCFL